MSRALGGARRTLRSATPLSRSSAGPEALRPGITAGLPWTNDSSHHGLYAYKRYVSSVRAWEGLLHQGQKSIMPTEAILAMTNARRYISTGEIICTVIFITLGAIAMGNNLVSSAQRGEGQ